MIFQLSPDIAFPDPMLAEDDGLLALGGDLSVDRLLLAYSFGIFPWFNPGDEIMWWASPFRPIYTPGQIKVNKSLRNTLRKYPFKIVLDTHFEDVIHHCASIKRSGEPGTWISEEIISSYRILFEMGYLHTVEVFLGDRLVGGLYGISLGKAFFGESMFHLMPNTSKVALFALSEMLQTKGFSFIDSQVTNPHSLRMGAKEVSRKKFNEMLDLAMEYPTEKGPWTFDFGHLADRLPPNPASF
jgi:leucyl/phenylalanyl-tRNA--protein transferase